MPKGKRHIPVMLKEIIEYLGLGQGNVVLDCTVGLGGHAQAILQAIGPRGKLIGLDFDQEALDRAKQNLKSFNNCTLLHDNFRNIDTVLNNLKVNTVDGMVFDLGVSSLQLEEPARGFSFRSDAPLDMRMDKDLQLSAFDLVNFLPQENLADILKKYGQERWHNRIARAIVRERQRTPIVSTGQLAALIIRILPYKYSKIHPATRTFQALRIAVNDELEALQEALNKCVQYMKPQAKICVISFHSLEDRIVKHQFRRLAKEDKLKILTKKPIAPSEEEIRANPRARSAKLRVAERK
ncbi:MAG: 16S rRNA (cytosine(1402)-N(4))-methyltransferase RsmH [Candidatus Omnitrophica bacterium]|nr:16S rRNA (cytosine(1402)-N(4))-methyltransferase RsmH [Candidatus Omnitrophota bacterium]